MYEITRLIHLTDPDDPRALDAVVDRVTMAASATEARRTLVSPTLAGVRNGGDLIVHLQFDSEEEWRRGRPDVDWATSGASVARVNSVEYHGGNTRLPGDSGRRQHTGDGTVYRTLLLRVDETASDRQIDEFERTLLRMPRYVTSMRAWQLSHVAEAGGDSRWTHVWEQEFSDVDGLLGEYMDHPIHWASVDAFFDPENPRCIVRERVCHSFCSADDTVVPSVELADSVDSAR
ncbi:Dabb family protein [Gordonia sp. ABKF26]|uniref:Dabb family protein n=1 Tax=Gordonia sp. ABKF26 TaxID=3238687 RepID=UPI0034E527E3